MTRASLATVYPSILTSYFCAQWWVLVACLVGVWVALVGLSGAMGWGLGLGCGSWGLAGLIGLCGLGAWLWVLGPGWPVWAGGA